MQLKMGKTKSFNAKKVRRLLESENEFIHTLLVTLEVPESVTGIVAIFSKYFA